MEHSRVWLDLTPTGRSPSDIGIQWTNPVTKCIPPRVDAQLERTVQSSTEEFPEATAVNLESVENERLTVSTIPFAYYLARQILLDPATPEQTAKSTAEYLRSEINVLSTFNALIVDGHVLLGLRPKDWRGGYPVFSAPGGGYLNEADLQKPPTGQLSRAALLRELTEEVGVGQSSVDVCCLGIFEEVGDRTDANPALFSLLTTSMSRKPIQKAWENAEDSDEFVELIWVPLEPAALEQIILEGQSEAQLPKSNSQPLELPVIDYSLTPKTTILLYLIGEERFDSNWAARMENIVTFDGQPSVSSESG